MIYISSQKSAISLHTGHAMVTPFCHGSHCGSEHTHVTGQPHVTLIHNNIIIIFILARKNWVAVEKYKS